MDWKVLFIQYSTQRRKAVKIELRLTGEDAILIEDLMFDAGIQTKQDLINSALTLFEWAIGEVKAGRIIASVNEKEKMYKEVVMPVFSYVPRQSGSA